MHAVHDQPPGKRVAQIVPAEVVDTRCRYRLVEPLVSLSICSSHMGENSATFDPTVARENLTKSDNRFFVETQMPSLSVLAAGNPNHAPFQIDLRPLQVTLFAKPPSRVYRDQAFRHVLQPFRVGIDCGTQSNFFFGGKPTNATTWRQKMLNQFRRIIDDFTRFRTKAKDQRQQRAIAVVRGIALLLFVATVLEEFVEFKVRDGGRIPVSKLFFKKRHATAVVTGALLVDFGVCKAVFREFGKLHSSYPKSFRQLLSLKHFSLSLLVKTNRPTHRWARHFASDRAVGICETNWVNARSRHLLKHILRQLPFWFPDLRPPSWPSSFAVARPSSPIR